MQDVLYNWQREGEQYTPVQNSSNTEWSYNDQNVGIITPKMTIPV